ncbi:MAG: hypothetical protein CL494_09440 [Actinobacteria bacterium]|nr:hypothetical protein [Actinomycetota bacterium]
MRVEDSACERDEGRAGLPDVVVVPLDVAGVWMRDTETGKGTHPHYDELSEFIVFNCQNVSSNVGGESSDMYTLLAKNLPWEVISAKLVTRGLVLPKKPAGHGDAAYDIVRRADKRLSDKHHIINTEKAHELLTAEGMHATGELVRLTVGELDPLGYAANNAASLVHAGYLKRSLRIDLAWFAITLFIQDKTRRGKKLPTSFCSFMVDPTPVDLSRVLRGLAGPLKRTYEVMSLWCFSARHAKEKYGMTPPDRPDFGRVIYNKAVRLHLEDVGVLPPFPGQRPKRSMPFGADGRVDEAKILRSWETDTWSKDCRSREEAASFYKESMTFLQLLAQPQFAKSLHANQREMQRMYSDEFPELCHQTMGDGSIESFPAHVVRAWKRMPLPDQTGFVERLRMQVQSHKFMGGQLDDTFLRQLNYEIRQGLTSDMYDGWARVFQLRNKDENMTLLKMVIQASYMMLFLEAYQGEGNEVHAQRAQFTRDATKRLNAVCTTDIIGPNAANSNLELNPIFL